MPDSPDRVRLDLWLFAARFFKTRSLAAEAIGAGRVSVNGDKAKSAKAVKAGDRVAIRKPPYEWDVLVKAVADKRGSATVAQALYEEDEASRARREAVSAEIKAAPPPVFKGRPTKRDRRALDRFFRGREGE